MASAAAATNASTNFKTDDDAKSTSTATTHTTNAATGKTKKIKNVGDVASDSLTDDVSSDDDRYAEEDPEASASDDVSDDDHVVKSNVQVATSSDAKPALASESAPSTKSSIVMMKLGPQKVDKPGSVVFESLYGRQRVAARGMIDWLNEEIVFYQKFRQAIEQVLLKEEKLKKFKKDRVKRNEEIARQCKQKTKTRNVDDVSSPNQYRVANDNGQFRILTTVCQEDWRQDPLVWNDAQVRDVLIENKMSDFNLSSLWVTIVADGLGAKIEEAFPPCRSVTLRRDEFAILTERFFEPRNGHWTVAGQARAALARMTS